MDVAYFMSWFNARREGKWLKEKDWNGDTPLYRALQYKAPEAVAMALFEAWPDVVKEKDNTGRTPLCHALVHKAPNARDGAV